MAASKFIVLTTLLLASIVVAYDTKKNCATFCGRGGDKCKGRANLYKKVLECEKFNYDNRGFKNGPGICSDPKFILSRRYWQKFYPVRVCRRETQCIKNARKRNHGSTYLKRSMEVLEQRAKNYAIMDEIRFSEDKSYVNSVNRITGDKYMSELRLHVAKKGYETQTRFANPLFQKDAAVRADNNRLRAILSIDNLKAARRQRNTERQRFDVVFTKQWKEIQKARSKLKSAVTRQTVAGYINDVRTFSKYVRQLQAEAHKLQFIESEFTILSRDVLKKRKEVESVKAQLAEAETTLVKRRSSVSDVKKTLISKVKRATDAVKNAQDRSCINIT